MMRINPLSRVLLTSIVASLFLCAIKISTSWIPVLCLCCAALLHGVFGDRTVSTALAGKSVLVTGSGSGLGRGLAVVAARKGAQQIHLVARRKAPLEETAAMIQTELQASSSSQTATFIHLLDVSDEAAVAKVWASILAKHGCPDIIANNAGMGDWKHIEDTTMAECRQMMAVPYMGAFYLTSFFAKAMIMEGRTGHILNVTSIVSTAPSRSAVAYGTARGAMKHFSVLLREDLRECKPPIGVTLLNSGEISGTDYFQSNQAAIPWFAALPVFTFFNKDTLATATAAWNGVEAGEVEVIVPELLWCLVWLYNFLPESVLACLRIGDVGRRPSSSKQKPA